MGRYAEGINVNQMMFGFSFENMIEDDNPVRAIDIIVDNLAEKGLEFTYSTTKSTGRPPYNPLTMFKIYIYCYYNKIRSSRCIEKECKRNIELIWLSGGIAPGHKTIAEFRKNNKKAIEMAHRKFIRMCNDLELIGKEVVVLDGTKIRANNSRKKNVTISKLDKMISHYDESIHEYLNALVQNDIAENESQIKSKMDAAEKKKAKCEKLKEEMLDEGIKEKSLTDPDSHKMKVSNKGTEIAYNVQNVVDSKEHLIVTTEVSTSPADQTQLKVMAKQAADELEIKPEEEMILLADKGYWCAEDLKGLEEDERINAIVAPTDEKGTEGYRKSDFKYNEERDEYTCPMGQVLHRSGKKNAEYLNKKACSQCPNRDKCTKAKKGRVITRGEYEEVLKNAVEKYKNNKELYHKRQEIVEHPFGTIKRTLGFTYFLTRGKENVRTENFLHVLIYNIKRLLKISGRSLFAMSKNGKPAKTSTEENAVFFDFSLFWEVIAPKMVFKRQINEK